MNGAGKARIKGMDDAQDLDRAGFVLHGRSDQSHLEGARCLGVVPG
jgi:hypothetical protein